MSIPVVAKFEFLSSVQGLPQDHSQFILPKRSTPGSAGYDFFNPYYHNIVIQPGEHFIIPTGIKCRINEGWVLQLYPRSGLGFKHQLRIANTVGIIDSDYYNNPSNEGEIVIKLVNGGDTPVSIAPGKAYCQGVFVPFGITEDDNPVNSERIGGFGSSDNQNTPSN